MTPDRTRAARGQAHGQDHGQAHGQAHGQDHGQDHDVVITGMGVVTPIGAGVADFWDGVLAGRSGLRREERTDLSDLPGGWVCGVVEEPVREALLARADHSARPWGDVLLHEAVDQALRDAAVDAAPAGRTGLVWARVWPGPTGPFPQDYETAFRALGTPGDEPRPVALAPELMDRTRFPAEIAERLGTPLIGVRVEATCAGGVRALVEAARLLRSGAADLVVVAASSSRNTPYVLSQFAQLMALSRWRGDPSQASMPFDRRRCGFVMNESSGAMVLETAAHAAARGARTVHAVLAGWGLALDNSHVTAPTVEAVERVMRTAVSHAGLGPHDIDHVNAHGTSTRLNDLVEAQALHRVFGARTAEVDVSAVKSLIGHGSAASGLTESVVAALTVSRGIVPPVVTCTEPDPACDVRTHLRPVHREVRAVVKNSFGFGGQYASIVLLPPSPAPPAGSGAAEGTTPTGTGAPGTGEADVRETGGDPA